MAREGIHPKFFNTEITCITCGTTFASGSTKGTEIRVDTCSSCHPFYTGTQQFSSAAGRVERFKTKMNKKVELAQQAADTLEKQKNQKKASKKDNKKAQ